MIDEHGKSYWDRWLTPQQRLNQGTVYAERPVGNSPELMPLDCSLNKDINDCVARHVLETQDCEWDDDVGIRENAKFDCSTVRKKYRADYIGIS